jgi:hypothetical protein
MQLHVTDNRQTAWDFEQRLYVIFEGGFVGVLDHLLDHIGLNETIILHAVFRSQWDIASPIEG